MMPRCYCTQVDSPSPGHALNPTILLTAGIAMGSGSSAGFSSVVRCNDATELIESSSSEAGRPNRPNMLYRFTSEYDGLCDGCGTIVLLASCNWCTVSAFNSRLKRSMMYRRTGKR